MSSPTASPRSSTHNGCVYQPSRSSISKKDSDERGKSPLFQSPQLSTTSQMSSSLADVEIFDHTVCDYNLISKNKIKNDFSFLSKQIQRVEKDKIISIALEIQKKLNQAFLKKQDREQYIQDLKKLSLPNQFNGSELIDNLIKAATHKNFYNCYHDTKINWFGVINKTKTIQFIIQTLQQEDGISEIEKNHLKHPAPSVAPSFDNADTPAKLRILNGSYKSEVGVGVDDSHCLQNTFLCSLQTNQPVSHIELKGQTIDEASLTTLPWGKGVSGSGLVEYLNKLCESDLKNEENIKSVVLTLNTLVDFPNLPDDLVEKVVVNLTHLWEWATEIKNGGHQNPELEFEVIQIFMQLESKKTVNTQKVVQLVVGILNSLQASDLEKEQNIKLVFWLLEVLGRFSNLPDELTEKVYSSIHYFSLWAGVIKEGKYKNRELCVKIFEVICSLRPAEKLINKEEIKKDLFVLHAVEVRYKMSKNDSIVEGIIWNRNFPFELRLEFLRIENENWQTNHAQFVRRSRTESI